MTKSLMKDAFAHHTWATLQVIDACMPFTPGQLDITVPGTYGSILNTIRHIVEGDSFDLTLFGIESSVIDEGGMGLAELRANTERFGTAWLRLLEQDFDPDSNVHERDDDGFERDASISIRLASAIVHGAEHRSQICTAITSLGIKPPPIDVFDFGTQTGRVTEIPPTS